MGCCESKPAILIEPKPHKTIHKKIDKRKQKTAKII